MSVAEGERPGAARLAGNGCHADQRAAGDIGQLYSTLSKRLEQAVRLDVVASDAVIEDACQFAWSRLVHHAHRVRRETAFAWLVRTAVREAVKLVRRGRRELSLDVAIEHAPGGSAISLPLLCSPDEVIERRARLAEMRQLPERQQRLLWLQALGLSYAEMAAHEGYTRRTVERQLLRAKRTLRQVSQ